jgi:serine/threonine protein kinase
VVKAGDVVGGYRLLEDFRVVGAGLSEWTFAERDGREFFLKRFLSPTYPDDAAPGSATTKARKRARCAAFEAHHRGMQVALAPVTRYGGNLIATLDFFREGAKYYKVTEKVDLAGLEPSDVARSGFTTQLVLMKTVAHSLKILHDLHIVHSDLKPSNVMIKKTELGYTTKLIDFDSSYIVGSPPPPDEIVGTINYYSPELITYVQGGDAALTTASDIFALGLIYCEYLTGKLPHFDAADHEPGVAVLNGSRLSLPPDAGPSAVSELVERMMLADPAARPRVDEVHATLMNLRTGGGPTRGRPTRAPAAATMGPVSSLRGKGLRLTGSALRSAPAGPISEDDRVAFSTVPGASDGSAPRKASAARPTPPTIEPEGGAGMVSTLVGRLLTNLDRRRSR